MGLFVFYHDLLHHFTLNVKTVFLLLYTGLHRFSMSGRQGWDALHFQQCSMCTKNKQTKQTNIHTLIKAVRRLRSETGNRPVFESRRSDSTVGKDNGVCLNCYSRRYLRVCDSRSRRWMRRAPTPSERRPALQTRRRSPESRTGLSPLPSGPRPWFGG